MTPPVCACHGEPMGWNKDPRRKSGGYWRCNVTRRDHDCRYQASEKGRSRQRRYRESPAGSLNRQLLEMTRIRVHY